VGRLAYKLELPSHWRIHPVFTIAQLEPCPSPDSDHFKRSRPDYPKSVFVDGDTERVKSFEVDRLVGKREAVRGTEYLLRWKGYGPEWDEWRNLPELENATDLVNDYESAIRASVSLPGRHSPEGRITPKSHAGPLTLIPSGRKFAVVIPPSMPKPTDQSLSKQDSASSPAVHPPNPAKQSLPEQDSETIPVTESLPKQTVLRKPSPEALSKQIVLRKPSTDALSPPRRSLRLTKATSPH